MSNQKCKYCGSLLELITPLTSLEHCCIHPHCMAKFRKEQSSNYPTKRCDLCRKDKRICPTGLGGYLGEKNPDLCDDCKDILEPISEPTCKLILWEINKDK